MPAGLSGRGYSVRSIWRRVPIAFAFGEFAHTRGARSVAALSAHVAGFVAGR